MTRMQVVFLAAVLGMVTVVPLRAQSSPPSKPWSLWGQVWASAFGEWTLAVDTGIPAAGTYALQLSTATPPVLPGGQQFQPLSTNAPLLIDPGPNQEKVTPSAVACSFGQNYCSITVTLAKAHPGRVVIESGSSGLQEAINYQHARGGAVRLDPAWDGTTAMITAAAGYANVEIVDERLGHTAWYGWNGTTYQLALGINAGAGGALSGGFTSLTATSPAITPTSIEGVEYADQFAHCDGVTDDTTALESAWDAAIVAGRTLDLSGKTCAVTSVTIAAGSSNVSIQNGTIVRVASDLQAPANLVTVTTTGSFSTVGVTYNMLGNGSSTNESYDALEVMGATAGEGPSSAVVRNNSFLNAQNVGFQCVDCSNVMNSGNYSYHNYWVGEAFTGDGGSGGTGPNATYTTWFTSCGNLYDDEAIGLELNFYIRGASICSAETFIKSSLALTQMPDAEAKVGSPTFVGSSTYGIGGPNDGIFMEGVSNAEIGAAAISDPGAYGVVCQGSELQILPGPNIALPCRNVRISAHINGTTTQPAIRIVGASYPGTISSCTAANPTVCTASYAPQTGQDVTISGLTSGWTGLNGTFTATSISSSTFSVPVNATSFGSFSGSSVQWVIVGSQNAITNAQIVNSLTCGGISSTAGAVISATNCDTTQVGGWALSGDAGWQFTGNTGHNIGIAVASQYSFLDLASGTVNGIARNNSAFNDPGVNSMQYGIHDDDEGAGIASNTVAFGNSFPGLGTNGFYPSGIPQVGTFGAGAMRQQFPGAAGSPTLDYCPLSCTGSTGWIVRGCSGTSGPMVGGTVTVTNACITGSQPISLAEATKGGTQGILSYAESTGQVVITSSSSTDTSTVSWVQN